MRLLADENLPEAIVLRLLQDGCDVARVRDLAQGVPDEVVARLARDTKRILPTSDKGFGDPMFLRHSPIEPGLILLRLGALHPAAMATRVAEVLPQLADLTGRIVVIDQQRVRVRWFPRVVT